MNANTKLLLSGTVKLLSGLLLTAVLLFCPAGTFRFPGAWRMLLVLFVPMLILGAVLYAKDKALLEKRLNSREGEKAQKGVILLSGLMFVSVFLVCGFDFRFGWSRMPLWLSVTGCVLFLLGYIGFAELLRENAYLSRTVEIQEGQKVIDSGMYGIVRHPMYSTITVMYLSIPLIVGSFWALIPFAALPVVLGVRIVNEEKVLREGLPGYEGYTRKVKYRMFLWIW
ncbi:MAG: methyltransferase family protein [Candidatus Cryptobacteroides sp.]